MTTDFAATSLSTDEARVLTDEVREDAAALWAKLLRLHEGRAWEALGYANWTAYCAAEFDMGQSRAYQMLDAARVMEALTDSNMLEKPASDRVARELVPVLIEIRPGSPRNLARAALELAIELEGDR